jgi:hypothetical protein
MSKGSRIVRQFFTRRGIVGLLACAVSAGTLGAVGVSDAGAALRFEAPITFECYNNGIIQADEINRSIDSNQGEVVWNLHLDIWNARTQRWVPYYNSPFVHYNSDDTFGELEDPSIDVWVAHRHYYLAYDAIGTTGTQNPARLFRDHAEIGGTSEFVCYVP